MSHPAAVAVIGAAEQRGVERRERRASQAQKAERQASRTRHRGLGRDAARALAKERFPHTLTGPIPNGYALPPGGRVDEFLNDHWARVQTATGAPLVVTSALPMRTADQEPVALGLQDAPGGYRSRNPLVDVEYAGRATGGARLAASSIEVVQVGAKDVPAALDGDRLFFADVLGAAADTDQIVVPRPAGLQVLWQLRSPQAPDALELRFDLPAGATLRLSREFLDDVNAPLAAGDPQLAGAEIVRDGQRLAYVAPPGTFDADGERVPTHYEIDGDVLKVVVDHRGRDLAYPLLVDPEINDTFSGRGLGDSDKWYSTQNVPAGSTAFSFARNFQRDGLQVGAYQWAYYVDGSMGGWNWQAPDGAYVRAANFTGLRHLQNASSLITGIFRPGVWEGGPNYNYAFANGEGMSRYEYAGSPTERNIAFAGLYMHYTGQRTVGALASVSGATITAGDNHGPETTLRNTPAAGWTNYRWGAIGYDMTDRGLGLKAVSVTRSGDERATSTVVNLTCTGYNLTVPCPLSHNSNGFSGYGYSQQLPYDLEALGEGIHPLHVRAQDVSGNVNHSDTDGNDGTGANQPVWYARYDTKAPTLTVSGPLRTGVDLSAMDEYPIEVSATDGVPGGTLAQRRSGVASLKLYVGSTLWAEAYSDASCEDSCELRFDPEDTFVDMDSLSEGSYLVKVEAKDRLGHTATDQWYISVPREVRFGALMDAWKRDVERRVDEAVPAVPLTGPMPAPPADWRNRAAGCVTSESAQGACYDRISDWGRDVLTWLRSNLALSADDLPDPPSFDFSLGHDTQRELTFATRDAFANAKAMVVPTETANLQVAVNFHRTVDGATVRALLPELSAGGQTFVIRGVHDPSTGSAGGLSSITAAAGTDALAEFYRRQLGMANGVIENIEGDERIDVDEQRADDEALIAWRGYRDALAASGTVIDGVTVQISALRLQTLLADPANLVKSIAQVPVGTEPRSTLAARSTDRETVATENANSSSAGARASSRPACTPSEEGVFRLLTGPSPSIYAPSRFSGRTQRASNNDLSDAQNKLTYMNWQWQAGGGLRWVCAKPNSERNIEVEAKVAPTSSGNRWSSNWERDFDVVEDMPGPVFLDDLNSGDRDLSVYANQHFQDYALLTRATRAFRYGQRYSITFRTNEGNTNSGDVLFRMSATHLARTGDERKYCDTPGPFGYKGPEKDYEHCMFAIGETVACYNRTYVRPAGSGPSSNVVRRVDWRARLGAGNYSLTDANRSHDADIDLDDNKKRAGTENGPGGQVVTFCDPSPSGDR